MKNLIILFFLIPIQNSICAQNWFDSSDTWVYRYSSNFEALEGYSEYSNVRDTIVNGLNTKAIDGYYKYYSYKDEQQLSHENTHVYYEDSNKVYTYDHRDSLILLYDFNLVVGDSISYIRIASCDVPPVDPPGSIVLHLDSLGTININNEDLVMQHFSYYDYDYNYEGTVDVIETIGSPTFGFRLYEIRLCDNHHPSNEILCSVNSQNEIHQFLNEDCYYVLVSTDNVQTTQLQFFPNPVNNELYIETEESKFLVNIYNQNGRIISSYSNERSLTLPSHMSNGMYFVELTSKDKRSYAKLIKI